MRPAELEIIIAQELPKPADRNSSGKIDWKQIHFHK